MNILNNSRTIFWVLSLLGLMALGSGLKAQSSFILSSNADFSTDDRVFEPDATLYMRVVDTDVDFTDIDENEFKLEVTTGEGEEVEGQFDNLLNGTYEAQLDLSLLSPGASRWKWKARIEDDRGNKFEAKANIEILNGHGEDVTITGKIETLAADFLVVEGKTITVTPETRVFDLDNQEIPYANLNLGNRVEVDAFRDASDELTAREIMLKGGGPGEDDVEIKGRISEIGDDFLVIAGQVFQVDGQTEIVDERARPLPFSMLQVGFVADVRAEEQPDGSLLAIRIKVEDAFEDEVETKGAIEEIGADFIVVSGLEFKVTETTVILDDDERPISFSDLVLNSVVEVKAIREASGRFVATLIEVDDSFEDEIELTGSIDEIGADWLIVSGLTFLVDAATEIVDEEENVIAFGALTVGLLVEIKADVQPDNQYLAREIEIEDRIEDDIELAGAIEELTATSLTLLGRTFGLTENTVVLDQNNDVDSLSALFVGQTVEVRGDVLPGGTLVAIRIKIEDRPGNEMEVVGPIEFLDAATLAVVGVQFSVDDATKVLDDQNNAIDFASLQLGQTVEVKARRQPDGSRLAIRIEIEDVLLLSGLIEQVVVGKDSGVTGIVLVQHQVLFDAGTIILGRLNVPLTAGQLAIGQFAEVRAIMGDATTIFATRVRVPEIVTSVAPTTPGIAGQPEEFALRQNYPNPFNPTTTISFQLPSSSGGPQIEARLTIFNLLGQKVATLVNEALSAGSVHTRQWDGRDERGNKVASGVFLYRLQAGDFVETKRMLLIR